MSPNLLDASITLICVSLSFLTYAYQRRKAARVGCQGYILQNSVTHARHLPIQSAHAFTYPTLSLLVSLRALEEGRLDLGYGFIFGYGGLWGRLTGLRPKPYLTAGPGSIKQKLVGILQTKGLKESLLADAWMMTMPSFLGLEGINPLTVYFAYDAGQQLTLVVLEIHNTFGESHLHILQPGVNEDASPDAGYDYQWTFRREFHVSPFNDRSGFYRISVKAPTHSPMLEDCVTPQCSPKPVVRVHLYTVAKGDHSQVGDLKLRAILRPVSATPLTSASLLLALLRAPLGLLLTMPRILFMAWKLHYQKRLDVFLRPDPLPASIDYTTKSTLGRDSTSVAGGVKWLDEGPMERYARRRVERFLTERAEQMHVEIVLIPADPTFQKFKASPSNGSESCLTVSYLSSRFFMVLFTSPSAHHALLLGCDVEEIFHPSSRELFVEVFSSTPTSSITRSQRFRAGPIPAEVTIPIPYSHFLDDADFATSFMNLCVLCVERLAGDIERRIFYLFNARIVEGTEPWIKWQRTALFLSNKAALSPPVDIVGSVRRA
ncbi:hypothetical protein CVT24_003304 [Panaeolus cyanescens]|uniref:DUF1365 domain-containing protein n=1 Tax=Panaeolus cyanescens TaxID=181874 RepID=A0A409Y6K6_9AGAR|nr:hypothetical protein CVT24_003304 [Panaeolus cyanescens]